MVNLFAVDRLDQILGIDHLDNPSLLLLGVKTGLLNNNVQTLLQLL